MKSRCRHGEVVGAGGHADAEFAIRICKHQIATKCYCSILDGNIVFVMHDAAEVYVGTYLVLCSASPHFIIKVPSLGRYQAVYISSTPFSARPTICTQPASSVSCEKGIISDQE